MHFRQRKSMERKQVCLAGLKQGAKRAYCRCNRSLPRHPTCANARQRRQRLSVALRRRIQLNWSDVKRKIAAVLGLCGCLWAFSTPGQTTTNSQPSLLLTNIAQVRALSDNEARRGYTVRLKAVVTFEISLQYFFIHDLTDGLCVERGNGTFHLQPGQMVELEGTTRRPEDYAPIVKVEQVKVVGEGQLPAARHVPFDELVSNQEDCHWLEVRAIVRTVTQLAENRFALDLAVAGRRLRVHLPALPAGCESRMVDSTVVVRGVRGCIFNQKRQVLAPLLFVDTNNLVVEDLASEDAFAIPERPLPSLLQFTPNPRYGHRLKVRGVVTHQQPGRWVFIADGTQGLRLQTVQTNLLKPGDIIEAVGFEAAGRLSPLLEDAVFRQVGHGPPPKPAKTTVAEVLGGIHDADLVAIEGTLVGSVRRGTEEVLIMQENGVAFDAQFNQTMVRFPDLRPLEGGRLRLTGVFQVQDVVEDDAAVRPETFRILLRSPGDIVILKKPPWWNARRLGWLLSGVTVLFLTVLGGVIMRSKLKRLEHGRERAEAEARFSTIMAERNRMAREIHDTLAQGYTAISAQLELLKGKVTGSAQAAEHLELARGIVRSSLAEARRSIWEMRSQALEDAELPQALAKVAEQLTAGTGVRVHVQTEGTVRRLPVVVENNLLRIGQEAFTNALKHAGSKQIWLAMDYEPNRVLLRVRDDGCGFDSSKVVASKNGGFGLVGMLERVEQLNGRFVVKSQAGHGTEVLAEVPVA
jgi:signal transduction histidine kinase